MVRLTPPWAEHSQEILAFGHPSSHVPFSPSLSHEFLGMDRASADRSNFFLRRAGSQASSSFRKALLINPPFTVLVRAREFFPQNTCPKIGSLIVPPPHGSHDLFSPRKS